MTRQTRSCAQRVHSRKLAAFIYRQLKPAACYSGPFTAPWFCKRLKYMLVSGCPPLRHTTGLSATVARPETDHRDCRRNPGDRDVEFLQASQRSMTSTDKHRSSVDKLPALRSAQKEALREVDEVSF